jgi:hypothetical protein
MDLPLLHTKWFAVLMIAHAPDGKNEWAFFEGTATRVGDQLIIDRGSGNLPFAVPEDTFDRIKPVDENLRRVFDRAEFFVPLQVGSLPQDADLRQYHATGMRWPGGDMGKPKDAATLRQAFRSFLGDERFAEFIRQFVRVGRLRHWQEEVWAKFVSANPEFAVGEDELRAALRICELHGCGLQPDTVVVAHEELPDAAAYLQAHFRLFPHSGSGRFANGPPGGRVEISYCRECRAAEEAWKDEAR